VENLASARGATIIEAAGRVVMPGFVDSHTHLTFPSAPPDDLEAARRVRTSSGQRIEARARTSLASMARHGTTTVEVKTGSGTDESAECKLLRVLAAL
jgi:imidazolonepropionase